jgi:single-stranded-DNA-specific exonuclease
MAEIERLEPFGERNPEPTFLARAARVRAASVVGGEHLKLLLEQGGRTLAAIGFGMADRPVERGSEVDVLYSPMISEWGGQRTLELRLRDLKRTQ